MSSLNLLLKTDIYVTNNELQINKITIAITQLNLIKFVKVFYT